LAVTLQQLRIFWAVAHGASLTRAAKQLGLTQPSLSQQIAKLEQAVDGRLFDRLNNQLVLNDAGRFFLRKAETILAELDEAETGLAEFRLGQRGRIAIGAVASLARSLIPPAWRSVLGQVPDLELDVHELAPAEAVEQLYGRNLQMAVLSAYSLAPNRISFNRVEVGSDTYALAVPRGLDLAGVRDLERDLPVEARRVLSRCIQFNFGNQHTQRTEEWYRRVLPRHQVVAQCRTYEVALAMVEAGLGVALVPLLTTQLNGRPLFDVDLYPAPGLERPIVALVPPQYLRVQPFAAFVDALAAAGGALRLPDLPPPPPFLARPPAAIGDANGSQSSQRRRAGATWHPPAPSPATASREDDDAEEGVAGPEGPDDPGEHGSHDVPAGAGVSPSQ
jgi:LysR family transcriptional activator of glutamate synthase operon